MAKGDKKKKKQEEEDAPVEASTPREPQPPHPLKLHYQEVIRPTLMDTFQYENIMMVPTVQKVTVNVGLGEAIDNERAVDHTEETLVLITGQKPVVTRARKSIAGFKLREGRRIGVKVDLRGERMWSFLDRLINVALPRTRDFRGISPNSFDGRGNYTLGLREQILFPEIEFDKVDKVRGMEISIVTSAENDEEGRELLRLLGMPFTEVQVVTPDYARM
ncbi:MAG: 50S ribosomal protein L5 [Chloroflexi bacterium]|nr:50S ribosomal protein L5 [Chloroflexota bacterium]